MSLDYHFSLQAAQPCKGKAIEYAATAFLTTPNRSAIGWQIALGKTAVDPADVLGSTQRVLDELNPRVHNRLIGINYFRFCNLRPHNQLQLERVGAVAFTKENSNQFVIKPNTLVSNDGIGAARSVLPNHHLFAPVIDFATLASERDSNPPTVIIEAAAARPGNPAYIAVRGLETIFAVR